MASRITVRHAPATKVLRLGLPTFLSLRLFQKLRQLRNIYCDSPRLVTRVSDRSTAGLLLKDIRQCLPSAVAHHEADLLFLDRPGRREAAGSQKMAFLIGINAQLPPSASLEKARKGRLRWQICTRRLTCSAKNNSIQLIWRL